MQRTSHQLPKVASSEDLPFDVEIERRPIWVDAACAGVIVVGALVAAKVVPMIAFVPLLVVSSLGRRFASSALHVVLGDEGLTLGERFVPRADIRDVWLDDDEVDARVVVAHAGKSDAIDLAVLWFANREQARRFAMRAIADVAPTVLVAGHRPRPADALPSLRFVAIAVAFFAMGSWYGGLSLVFFGLGAKAFFEAKQLVVNEETFTLTGALGRGETFRRAQLEDVDVDYGVLRLRGGDTLKLARANARDVLLGSPRWADNLRRRALKALAAK